MTGNVTYRATGTDHYSYPQFSFRIPIALAKICFSRIVINYAKILLYQQAPSLNSYVRQNRGGGMTSPTRHQKPYAKMADIDASINVKPEEGGDPGHMWGIWPLLPSPPSGIWLRIWAPGWGCLLFLHGGMGPSPIVPCARLCAGHLGIEVARLKPWKTAVFNRRKHLFLHLYKNTTSRYLFSI